MIKFKPGTLKFKNKKIMSILIYAESAEGKLKKVAFELASYAKKK
jgi:electron transfer flavoprotein alpha subunit